MGQRYLTMMDGSATQEGIIRSWFFAWEHIQKNHGSMILNSFGVDTRKVITKTLHNELFAMSLTINFDLWDARDKKKFEDQYDTKLALIESETPEEPKRQPSSIGIDQSVGLMKRGRSRASLNEILTSK